ncbi:hypothetical protein YC2023_071516 [Brassica napus]
MNQTKRSPRRDEDGEVLAEQQIWVDRAEGRDISVAERQRQRRATSPTSTPGWI